MSNILMKKITDDILQGLKKEFNDYKLAEKLEASSNRNIIENIITQPKKDFGDLTINCLVLNSLLNLNVEELVKRVADSFKNHTFVEKISIIGGYVNIFIKPEFMAEIVLQDVLKKNFSVSDKKNKNVKVLIEHTSINPSGPVNVGRIRNSFIGDTLVRVYKELGFNVESHFYVNDVGKQVAIITWAREANVKPDIKLIKEFDEYKDSPDFKTMFIYVPANKIVKEDRNAAKEVEFILKECESGDKTYLNKMRDTAAYCLDGQKKTLKRFGISFDSFDFESNFLENGQTQHYIAELKKLPQYKIVEGNHALDLSEYGFKSRFGGAVFQRKNGTSVYLVRDIAYHAWKKNLADKMITVLGEDHKVEFKMLRQILKLLGIIKRDDELEVVHFAFVSLKQGKLSTRQGRIVPADSVLDEGTKRAIDVMKKNDNNVNKKIAESIAVAAIRYSELKVAPLKQITFDWESSLRFDGQTGPYLQYALVRAKKIIKKSGYTKEQILRDKDKVDYSLVNSNEEKELFKKMLLFADIVNKTAEKKAPHILANYAYDLADSFTGFYEKRKVICNDKKLQEARLLIVLSFEKLLGKLLHLLGIEEVNEM